MNKPRTVAEAAEFLGCSESWLHKQCAKLLVPHARVAGRLLFTEEHLAKILAAGEQEPITAPVIPIRVRRIA